MLEKPWQWPGFIPWPRQAGKGQQWDWDDFEECFVGMDGSCLKLNRAQAISPGCPSRWRRAHKRVNSETKGDLCISRRSQGHFLFVRSYSHWSPPHSGEKCLQFPRPECTKWFCQLRSSFVKHSIAPASGGAVRARAAGFRDRGDFPLAMTQVSADPQQLHNSFPLPWSQTPEEPNPVATRARLRWITWITITLRPWEAGRGWHHSRTAHVFNSGSPMVWDLWHVKPLDPCPQITSDIVELNLRYC